LENELGIYGDVVIVFFVEGEVIEDGMQCMFGNSFRYVVVFCTHEILFLKNLNMSLKGRQKKSAGLTTSLEALGEPDYE